MPESNGLALIKIHILVVFLTSRDFVGCQENKIYIIYAYVYIHALLPMTDILIYLSVRLSIQLHNHMWYHYLVI